MLPSLCIPFVGGRRYASYGGISFACDWPGGRFLLLLAVHGPCFSTSHNQRTILTTSEVAMVVDALLHTNSAALGSNRIECSVGLLPDMNRIHGDREHPMTEIDIDLCQGGRSGGGTAQILGTRPDQPHFRPDN